MEELNRLGWAAGLSIVAFGVRFGIRSTSKKALERVIPHLPLGSKECASNKVELLYSLIPSRRRPGRKTRTRHRLYSGQYRLLGSRDFEKVGNALEEAMLISRREVADELGGLPPNKMHCSNLAALGLHKAIKEYLEKTGQTLQIDMPEDEEEDEHGHGHD